MGLWFHRCEFTKGTRPVTSRRISAAQRAIKKEQERYSLFPELVRETDPVRRIERHDTAYAKWKQKWRDERARDIKYMRMKHEDDRDLCRAWKRSCYPKEPEYFTGFLEQYMRYIKLLSNSREWQELSLLNYF